LEIPVSSTWTRVPFPWWTKGWLVQLRERDDELRISLLPGHKRFLTLGPSGCHFELGNPGFIWLFVTGVGTGELFVWGDHEAAEDGITALVLGQAVSTRRLSSGVDSVRSVLRAIATVGGAEVGLSSSKMGVSPDFTADVLNVNATIVAPSGNFLAPNANQDLPVVLVRSDLGTPLSVDISDDLFVTMRNSTQRSLGVTTPFLRQGSTTGQPFWRLGVPVTAPAAGAALVTVAAAGGQSHRCWGILFGKEDSSSVGNFIEVRDGAARLGGFSGAVLNGIISPGLPIFIGTMNTAMSVNVLNAGAAGIDYWAALLVETAL